MIFVRSELFYHILSGKITYILYKFFKISLKIFRTAKRTDTNSSLRICIRPKTYYPLDYTSVSFIYMNFSAKLSFAWIKPPIIIFLFALLSSDSNLSYNFTDLNIMSYAFPSISQYFLVILQNPVLSARCPSYFNRLLYVYL